MKTLEMGAVLSAMSHALDLTEGQPPGHCVRATWIAIHVAQTVGADAATLHTVHYATLMKDLGCSSNAARVCELYLADDLAFKRDFKFVDGSLSSALRFVLTHTGTGSQLTERVNAIANILRNGGEIARELIATRCERGAEIAAALGLSADVQAGVAALDEHWNGAGKPNGWAGADIPFASRIALLAQVADVFLSSGGLSASMRELQRRSGKWFEPELVDAYMELCRQNWFIEGWGSPTIDAELAALPSAALAVPLLPDTLDNIAEAFAGIVDAKSPFTSEHSRRVSLFADMIADELGLSDIDRTRLRRGGLLHDVGKLGVSNDILDLDGRPSDAQWQMIRMHPRLGEDILAPVAVFADLAPLAAHHHERLDGKGYPYGLRANDLDLATRIMSVADVFDALTADRPYRSAMPIQKAFDILDTDTGTAFDGDIVAALRRAMRASELLAA